MGSSTAGTGCWHEHERTGPGMRAEAMGGQSGSADWNWAPSAALLKRLN